MTGRTVDAAERTLAEHAGGYWQRPWWSLRRRWMCDRCRQPKSCPAVQRSIQVLKEAGLWD